MKRLIGFTIKLAVIVVFAMWFVAHSGRAHIVWHDHIIETSSAFLVLCVFAVSFAFFTLHRIWRIFRNGPEMYRLRRKIGKLHEGHRHLTHGLVAVAAGHAAEAGRRAVGARKLLGVTTATRLLQAQAAQLAGDHKMANEIFLALASEPDSAVLGYRGLIMEAFRARNWEEAGRLAGELHRVRPETPWLNLIRFELATRQRQWGNADAALTHIAASRLMEPARARQHQAAALLAASEEEAQAGHANQSLQEAERAAKLAPGWIPAILSLARRQMETGHRRAARRTVERAWPENPHPQLANLYRDNGDTDPLKSYKRIAYLCRGNEERPVSRMALAEAALAADIWGEARRHLQALDTQGDATHSTYRLLARLERCESGNEQAAMQWLSKALDAPPDSVWLCRACGGIHDRWQATCRHCGTFNALEWHAPGQSRATEAEVPALLSSGWAG